MTSPHQNVAADPDETEPAAPDETSTDLRDPPSDPDGPDAGDEPVVGEPDASEDQTGEPSEPNEDDEDASAVLDPPSTDDPVDNPTPDDPVDNPTSTDDPVDDATPDDPVDDATPDDPVDDPPADEPTNDPTSDEPDYGTPTTEPVTCPSCEATVPDVLFCEQCGARLDDEPAGPSTPPRGMLLASRPGLPCPQCSGSMYCDGYCDQCGGREPLPRDHTEEAPTAWVAGVCDRGVVHHRNEDSQAMVASAEPGQFAALVVCDGVSSVPRSDEASLAAAQAAVAVLDATLDFDSPEACGPDWAELMVAAAKAGNDAVVEVAGPIEPDGHNCPSCTFVGAVVDSGRITAASVGDSRAYWLPDAGTPALLTTDDSWAQEMIAAGIPRAQAERAPQAHAITRWLGPDAPTVDPPITTCEPDGPGWLCVCSDGLWNYCSEADELCTLVGQTAAANDHDPLLTARALVDWANAQGGRDNVTVVLARLVPATR